MRGPMTETYRYIMPREFALALSGAVGAINHDQWNSERRGSCIISQVDCRYFRLLTYGDWARCSVKVVKEYDGCIGAHDAMGFSEFFSTLAPYKQPA